MPVYLTTHHENKTESSAKFPSLGAPNSDNFSHTKQRKYNGRKK